MIESLATLLAFQLLGEALAHLSGWPIPGPVLGMAALFLAWPALAPLQQRLQDTADALLAHFGLLFVPAGVGVMLHAGLLALWWLPLTLGVLVSVGVTLALGGWMFSALRRRRGGDHA